MHSRSRPGRRSVRAVVLILAAVLAGIHQPASAADRTAISGFAEWYALGLDGEPDTNAGRLVVSFDHALSRHASFAWELGVDHAGGEGADANQEVGFGQAFVAVSLGRSRLLRLGVFALPLGLTNEADEPTAFFGTEINPVESLVLPAGWCESGAALGGALGHGVSYDLAVTSGLSVPVEGSSSYLLSEGVRSVRLPSAGNLAVTGRLAWTALPGVEAAATTHFQQDVTGGQLGVEALLLESHVAVRRGPWGLRALYASWHLDHPPAGREEAEAARGRDRQLGWYVESFLRGPVRRLPGELGTFVRFSSWDDRAGDSAASRNTRWNAGINYWPVKDLVLKLDAWREGPASINPASGVGIAVGGVF
jgi:hypothetical protein